MRVTPSQRMTIPVIVLVGALVVAISSIGDTLMTAVSAAVGTAMAAEEETSSRDSYFPNTEPLGADELRVIALGTGTPNFRRSQASASWLVELGNGDKFLFDIGTGSLGNLAALEIPYT